MVTTSDHRLADAKAKPIKDVADLLHINGLVRAGREWVGPCPGIGCGGRDRFSINTAKNLFNCRICGAKGDQVHLVMFVRGLDFLPALDWLCGPKQELSAAELAERDRRDRENRERQEREQQKYRENARRAAWKIWDEAVQPEATPVRGYLTLRGIRSDILTRLPKCLRYHPACPYMVSDDGQQWREVHRGPAMVAAIQSPDGKFSGVHRTWLDLSKPKGKAEITDPKTGKPQKAKKTLGSKKGGAIRLQPLGTVPQLIMAEGIETTLSAMVGGTHADAAFWCGVDLGNMSGQRMLGKGRKFAGIPDMEDAEAFVPPEWVRELIFIQDGDSEPRLTRAKLLSGCRRAMAKRAGLKARIVPVPEGLDLNDVLMGAADGR